MEKLELIKTILWFILSGCLFMVGALTMYWVIITRREGKKE